MGQKNLREQIVKILLESGDKVVSGAELSSSLGVSRTAVWKHINQLRTGGYEIESVPSHGYRLIACPDLLLPASIQIGLETSCVGNNIEYHGQIDSTNQRAQILAEQGAAEGTVVLAESQQAGRGRMGRSWSSPPGVNVYTSVILRPSLALAEASQLTFMAAVAVARALEQACGVMVNVKWPNDILLNGKKVAGLLNELSAETEGIHYVVLGIGVNLNMDAAQFPDDLRYPATSIKLETGNHVERNMFVRTLYTEIDSLYQLLLERGFAPIRLAWESLFALNGIKVEIDDGGSGIHGIVAGIAEDGALLVDTGAALPQAVYSGDVRPV